ncbi:hypothetical protein [Streptomyces sp. NPDC050264]|uniref:hypothetical protein n=1 Tax=Streptomyces sp. NPDC050264 TaxID=3155038 RepID=UPI00343B6039
MPKPYPEEFRQDVVRVVRTHGPGVTIEQAPATSGVHAMTLQKWMRRTDTEEGTNSGTTSQDNTKPREARQRIKLQDQENRACSAVGRIGGSSTPASTTSTNSALASSKRRAKGEVRIALYQEVEALPVL